MSLTAALSARRSARGSFGRVPLAGVASLLHHGFRVNQKMKSAAAPQVTLYMRPYPSAGGLYPVEAYVIVNEVDGLDPCIAHYDTRTHELAILKSHDGTAFQQVEIRQGEGVHAAVVLVVTSVMERVVSKYGGRGYRFALLEAGHASQNVCLIAEALGWNSLVYSSYYDQELANLIGVDGVAEPVLSVILLGARS